MAVTTPKPTASATDALSYEDLYERWEKGNWRSTEIDFSQDRVDWHETFSELERKAALWNYAMFFHGEDSVADNLSPYIDAAPREEQKYFLATQQVDEARHAVFFARFMKEVVGAGDSVATSLAATMPELTWGFRHTFRILDETADALRKDRSKPSLAAAVTMYHIIVEATLAQPGQHFIEDYLTERELLPGFTSGMRNVSLDEQRHIGFGVKLLSDLLREDPDCREAMIQKIREAMTYSIGVFLPPNWDLRYIECFGSTMEEVYAMGMTSFESKLRTVGLTDEDLSRALAVPWERTPMERAELSIAMLRANYLGEKLGEPSKDPEAMRMLFESIARAVDAKANGGRPFTMQWDFADAEPWFLRVNNGDREVEQGRLENPDLSFRTRLADWVDVIAGREDPRRLVLKRKIKPRGSVRLMMRMPAIFGR